MIKYYLRYIVIKIIKIYQKSLSFDHGVLKNFFPLGYCKFQPTCSEYAINAIEKYGIITGGIKALWRVLRCNPWSKGGCDSIK